MDGVYRVTSRVRAEGLLNQRHETQRGYGDISDQKERTLFWPSKRKGGLEQRRRKRARKEVRTIESLVLGKYAPVCALRTSSIFTCSCFMT
jgi:hypothetical protein